MQRHPVETKRRMTTSSSTNKKQRTTAPSSSEQREASKFWNGFTQQLSDQTWLPTTDDALVQTDCSENTWFTATWKSKHDSTKNPHKVSHHAQHCTKTKHNHKRRRRRRKRCNNNTNKKDRKSTRLNSSH